MPAGLGRLTYSCGGHSLTQLLHYEVTLLSHEDGLLDSSKSNDENRLILKQVTDDSGIFF